MSRKKKYRVKLGTIKKHVTLKILTLMVTSNKKKRIKA